MAILSSTTVSLITALVQVSAVELVRQRFLTQTREPIVAMDSTVLDDTIASVLGPKGRSERKPAMKSSASGRVLLCLFAWGMLPAALLQKNAKAIVEDIESLGVVPCPALLKLAGLVPEGTAPKTTAETC